MTSTFKPRRFWFAPWGRPGMTQIARLRCWPFFVSVARRRCVDLPRFKRVGRQLWVRVGGGFAVIEWMP